MEADIWHQRTRGAATGEGVWGAAASLLTSCSKLMTAAAIAQLGERQTEDLKVPVRSRVSAFCLLALRVLCWTNKGNTGDQAAAAEENE